MRHAFAAATMALQPALPVEERQQRAAERHGQHDEQRPQPRPVEPWHHGQVHAEPPRDQRERSEQHRHDGVFDY